MCINPKAGDADVWIKMWEELHRLAARDVSADQTAPLILLFQCDIRHGLTQLLHEKSFVHINGDGNHCNEGLNTDTGRSLYVLGQTSEEQQKLYASIRKLEIC